MTISSTHPSTELLDAQAGAPSLGRPLDSDEAEYLALAREHPECICPTCHVPLWHPSLSGRLQDLWTKAEAKAEREALAAAELVHVEVLPADLEDEDESAGRDDPPAWEAAAITAGRLPDRTEDR